MKSGTNGKENKGDRTTGASFASIFGAAASRSWSSSDAATGSSSATAVDLTKEGGQPRKPKSAPQRPVDHLASKVPPRAALKGAKGSKSSKGAKGGGGTGGVGSDGGNGGVGGGSQLPDWVRAGVKRSRSGTAQGGASSGRDKAPKSSLSRSASGSHSGKAMSKSTFAAVDDWPSRAQPPPSRSSESWSDTYAPKNAAGLAVYGGTVKRVRSWLEEATGAVELPKGCAPRRLLVLSGCPGTGKSTTIRVVARELGVSLTEWNDTFGQVRTWNDRQDDPLPGQTTDSWEPLDEFHVPYSSQLDQFARFLHSGSSKPLPLSVGTATFRRRVRGVGGVGVGSDGGGSSVSSSAASSQSSTQGSSSQQPLSRPAFDTEGKQGRQGKRRTLRGALLLETLPATRDRDGEARLQQVLDDYIQDLNGAPGILIFSDVAEKNEASNALEKLLSRDIVNCQLVTNIEFNPITEKKTAKRLQEILRAERIHMSSAEVDAIAMRANGDLRQAVLELQLRALATRARAGGGRADKGKSKSKGNGKAGGSSGDSSGGVDGGGSDAAMVGSDTRLSSIHAIAKLCHAKNKHVPGAFKPETIIGQCDMAFDHCASFVQHNCVEFYTECDHLANGLRTLSDADMFVSRVFSTTFTREHGDTVYPEQYIASLTSRAVAASNDEPNMARVKAFKPVTKPKSYDSRKQQAEISKQLQARLRMMSGGLELHPRAITETVP